MSAARSREAVCMSRGGPAGGHIFPRWQFTDDGPLPGLRRVLAALPVDYHPLDVAQFMTSDNEALRERSPAQWLANGGSVQTVADLAGQLGYQ